MIPPVPLHDSRNRSPLLGRAVAGFLILLFLMVGLGIVWVWRRAERERAWREQVTGQPLRPPPGQQP